MATHKAPGKSHRRGITLMELADKFPNEEAAVRWFEGIVWPDGERCCGHCGGLDTHRVKTGKPMPYRCRDCRKYFSVRTGTALAHSRLPLRKWAFAVYLVCTNLKSISSMKLHRDIGVTQKTAWFMLHRIRETWAVETGGAFEGPVEVDEAYFGGLRRNMSNEKRKELEGAGRGPAGKTAVVGMKDRATKQVAARVVEGTDGETLQGFVDDHASADAKLYTDGTSAYRGTDRAHETVNHSAAEYVRYLEGETVHTNGVESFWSMLKRAHKGTFHNLSVKHLQRYVSEFAGRQNIREMDTIDQMTHVVAGLVGRRLMYSELVA